MTGAGLFLSRLEGWARARPRTAVALALAAGPAFLLKDALLGGALYARDIHLYWHAEVEAFVRAVAGGAWPVWDRGLGFGQPLLANSSAQVLYPPTWLNLVMAPWRYYTAFVLLHLVLSGAGMYAAARRLGLGRPAAVSAAAAWTASGPFVSLTILWHHFAGAAWLPWVLAGSRRLAISGDARSAVLLAAVMGAQILAGSFEMSAMGAAVAAAVLLCHLGWPRPGASARDRRLLLLGLGAGVLALAVGAGQWMATAEVATRSGRSALPRDVRTYWSVHPFSLGDFLLPGFSIGLPLSPPRHDALFEGREPFLASLYLGLSSAVLVAAALFDRGRRGRFLLAAAAAGAVLVALGRHAPVYDALAAILPPLQFFRYPVKVTVLVALPWSLLVGMGVESLRSGSGDARAGRRAARIAARLAAGAFALAMALALAGAAAGARNVGIAAAFTAASAAVLAGGRRGGGEKRAAAIAAVVAVADLLLYHRTLNAVGPRALYTHRPEVLAFLPPSSRVYAYDYSVPRNPGETPPHPELRRLSAAPEGWTYGAAFALAEQMALTPVCAGRWGLLGSYEVDYTGLFPVHVNQAAHLLRAVEGTPAHLRLLQLAGVERVVALHQEPFADLVPVGSAAGLFAAPVRVFAVPDPMPLAYVAAASQAGEGIPALARMIDPTFDFRREALVPAGAPPSRGGGGTARVIDARPDRLTLDVDAPGGGYLVVLESYDPGWRAVVDGIPAAVVPANALFRGVALPPGARRVEMSYRPRGLVIGLAVSALAALATGIAALRPGGR